MNALIGARDGPKPSNALAIGKECQDSDIALPIADFSNARHLIRKALGGRIKVMTDRKSTRLNSSHIPLSLMPSSALKKKNKFIMLFLLFYPRVLSVYVQSTGLH